MLLYTLRVEWARIPIEIRAVQGSQSLPTHLSWPLHGIKPHYKLYLKSYRVCVNMRTSAALRKNITLQAKQLLTRLRITQAAVAKIIGGTRTSLCFWLNGKSVGDSNVRSVGPKMMQWYSDNEMRETPQRKGRRRPPRKKLKGAPSEEAIQARPY